MYLHVGVLLLDIAPAPSQGTPCAHPCHQDVDLAIGVLPDLWPRGFVVDLGVVGVLKLLQHKGVGCCCSNVLCLCNGVHHPCGHKQTGVTGRHNWSVLMLGLRVSAEEEQQRGFRSHDLQKPRHHSHWQHHYNYCILQSRQSIHDTRDRSICKQTATVTFTTRVRMRCCYIDNVATRAWMFSI